MCCSPMTVSCVGWILGGEGELMRAVGDFQASQTTAVHHTHASTSPERPAVKEFGVQVSPRY